MIGPLASVIGGLFFPLGLCSGGVWVRSLLARLPFTGWFVAGLTFATLAFPRLPGVLFGGAAIGRRRLPSLRTGPLLGTSLTGLSTRFLCVACFLACVAGALVLRLTCSLVGGLVLASASSPFAIGLLATPFFSAAGVLSATLTTRVAFLFPVTGHRSFFVIGFLIGATRVGALLARVGILLGFGGTLGRGLFSGARFSLAPLISSPSRFTCLGRLAVRGGPILIRGLSAGGIRAGILPLTRLLLLSFAAWLLIGEALLVAALPTGRFPRVGLRRRRIAGRFARPAGAFFSLLFAQMFLHPLQRRGVVAPVVGDRLVVLSPSFATPSCLIALAGGLLLVSPCIPGLILGPIALSSAGLLLLGAGPILVPGFTRLATGGILGHPRLVLARRWSLLG